MTVCRLATGAGLTELTVGDGCIEVCPTAAEEPQMNTNDSTPSPKEPENFLKTAQQKILQHARDSGLKVTEMVPIPTGRYLVTFPPNKRKPAQQTEQTGQV